MKVYDTIIIGTGVVGYGTAMYSARLGMKTLVIGKDPGGTLILTDTVENYPGFKRLTGLELVDKVKEHALDYKENLGLEDGKVTSITRKNKSCPFTIKTDSKKEFQGKTIILATGSTWRKLPAKGSEQFENKGIHYCALCDGAFYKGKDVCVVGGSDSALKDALVLANIVKKVYIIYRGEKLRGEPPNLKRVEKAKNIEVIFKTNVTEIHGDKGVSHVSLDKPYKGKKKLDVAAAFVAIGHIPNSQLAESLGAELNRKKEVIINKRAETNIPGFFAAGDVADTPFKQAIVGVAEGVLAAYFASQYVGSHEVQCK